jgi:hypothetical protein
MITPNPSTSLHSALLTVCLGLGLGLGGCSGANIHKDLKADPKVMVRRWTLATHGQFDAGDHGTEFSNPVLVENTLVFGSRSQGLISIYPGMMQTRWVLPITNGVVSEITAEMTRE